MLDSSYDTDQVKDLLLEHYRLRNQVVLSKIRHARTATHQSIHELDIDPEVSIKDSKQFQMVQAYDAVWHEILNLFRSRSLSEIALGRIEKLLSGLPPVIKKIYNKLISEDKMLQKMIKTISKGDFDKALDMVESIVVDGTKDAEEDVRESLSEIGYVLRRQRTSPQTV
jgi:transposase-like protein